jgi:transposase
MEFDIGIPQRLGHLPLVMDTLRRTGLLNVLDHAIAEDPRSKVSTSECAAVILCGVFAGEHGLWRLRDRLAPYDMQTIMQDGGFRLEEFPEERFAKALDDIYAANPDKLMTAIALQMVDHFALNTDYLQFDTTSLSFYGAYEREDFGSMGNGIDPPRLVRGYSKDRRPDLKQLVFGNLVSADGGVPLWGKALDGNAADATAAAEFFTHVRKLVADPRKVCCVADCKGWTAKTLAIVHENGMRLLSRLPRNTALHRAIMDRPFHPAERIERPPKTKDADPEYYDIQGFDDETEIDVVREDEDGTSCNESMTISVRSLRVFSSALLKTKQKTLERTHTKECTKAKKLIRDWQQRAYACQADAERALQRSCDQHGLHTVTITGMIERVDGPLRRQRGRPRKHPEPNLPQEHFRITYAYQRAHHQTITAYLRRSATFVLIRTATAEWNISDREMVERYRQQYHVEHGFSWLKSHAAINPMFIETPHRIAAMCFLYCVGLMVWTLIQRTVRKNLKLWGKGLPYHRNKPSSNITTRFLFELFPKVQSLEITMPDGNPEKRVLGLDEWTQLACKALECSPSVFVSVKKSASF